MKERPILFSAPMIRAIREGRKTQTRRIVKPQPTRVEAHDEVIGRSVISGELLPLHVPNGWQWKNGYKSDEAIARSGGPVDGINDKCPFGEPGDRLLVAAEIPSSPNDDYIAGSDGQIYSRTKHAGFGRKERVDWYPLTACRDKRKGYLRITLSHENRRVTRSVHSLVCEAFYGRSPFVGAQVRHLDGDRENNSPSNLAWGTQAENWSDRKAHGNGIEGEKHHSAKLSDAEREHIRWAIGRGLCSQRGAARALGMSPASIQGLIDGGDLRDAEVADPGPRIPRITLEVTGVRVERLQDISEGDAKAEGVTLDPVDGLANGEPGKFNPFTHKLAFAWLWESIYADSWASNPWVWVIEFRKT